jgi:hypothetical protein
VIQLIKDDPNFHGNCQLLRRGIHEMDASNKNRVFHFECVNSFINSTFVVNNIGCPRNSLFVLTLSLEWANLFLSYMYLQKQLLDTYYPMFTFRFQHRNGVGRESNFLNRGGRGWNTMEG